jgi:diguanylate cyclase (GGDEF)-like protein
MSTNAMQSRGARLRSLMVLIVLLAVVPIFVLNLVRLQSNREAAVQRAYDHAAVLATAGVNAHREISDQARHMLEVLAKVPAVRTAALPECEQVLRSIQQGRKWLTGIFVVGADGKGICGGSPSVRTLDVSDREYFRNALYSGKYKVSDAITSRVTGKTIIAAVLPLYNSGGEFQAAIGAGVNLDWINRVSADVSSKFGGVMIVLDSAGRVIAYQPELPAGKSPQIDAILSAASPTFEAADPGGVQRLFSVAHLPDSGLTVAVGLDRDQVLKPIEQSFFLDLLFLVLVAIGSICAALLVAEFGLMRGVRALKSAAQRLKAGKMGLRVYLPGFVATELHDLAATYNAMTAEFERLAYLDRLTGLPNRRYLERHLSKRNERGERAAAGRHAVLAIDIDGFKPVNDSHGHAVGDRVLALIARRIASAVDERGLLFRVGGDEFVAVVPLAKTQGRDTARAIGEDIRQALEQSIELDGLTFPVACSVGIAMVPEDAKTLSGALVVADAALYEAKRNGRNQVVDSAPPLAAGLPGSDPRTTQYSASRMELGAPW